MLHKAWNSKGEMPCCFPRSSIKFQGHMVQNITDFDPNWVFPDYRLVAAFKSLRFALLFLAASVCLSVCLSVTPFSLCSHHRIIMKFSGVITSNTSDVHAKGQGQRSKVKVTEVTAQLNRFRWAVTPVWIHIWWWNDAYSLMLLRRGALLVFQGHLSIFKVTRL